MEDSSSSPKIVIVDDDKAFSLILKKRLESILPNAIFSEFGNLKEVRTKLPNTSNQFDLVLLDQHLPDGNGLELLAEGYFQEAAVLAVSSDNDPNIPGSAIGAGAAFFLSKKNVSDALFSPLVKGLIDRGRLNKQLGDLRVEVAVLKTVKTLVSTLRHEINNPLGGVLGGAYLLKNKEGASDEDVKAAEIVERSGQRIKHVLDELCNAISLDSVNKGGQEVYHIPGDKKWD